MIDFAAIESELNGTVHSVFGNATLTYLNGVVTVSVDGVLLDNRDEPEAINAPRGVRSITFQMLATSLGTLVAGTPVTVRSVNYSLSRIERDKTGWAVLHLRGGV